MVLSPMLTQFSPVQIVKVQCSPNSHQLKLLKSNAHPIFITSNGSKCNAHSILINSKYSSQTLTQFSPPTIGWCAILSQFSPDQKPTLQFSPNSHLCSQYSCNSHQLEMAGANAHLQLSSNRWKLAENWVRVEILFCLGTWGHRWMALLAKHTKLIILCLHANKLITS